jgi:Flp pilus assembly pilin Flp
VSSRSLLRRLLSDKRGTVFIEYSSLTLLLAIAAIAVFVQLGDVGVPPSHAGNVTTAG